LLQNSLSDSIARIDCYVEDISQVLNLDQNRVNLRNVDQPQESQTGSVQTSTDSPDPSVNISNINAPLSSIKEEEENEDDYPFDE
jgi:hypothetical protein